jgi:hypothetical protein
MTVEWNDVALEAAEKQITRAVEEAVDVVQNEHPGADYAEVRQALTNELQKRFEKGSGPDEAMTDNLAKLIVENSGEK